jgi:hypothetical protein
MEENRMLLNSNTICIYIDCVETQSASFTADLIDSTRLEINYSTLPHNSTTVDTCSFYLPTGCGF